MRYEDLEDDIKDGLQRFDRRMLFVSLVLFSLIALGFFYYDFSRHADSADVITNMIESKARNNKKEALMMLAAAKAENSFAGVALFDQQGKRYFHLPADRNPDFFKNRSLLDRIFNISIERNYYFSDERESAPAGRIVFIYNTLPTWIAISIGLLAIFFLFYRPGKNQLKNFILEKLRAVHENTKVKDIAGQVRHDWKSVKQGILAIAETSKGLENDERETLVMAINRMDGLLDDFSNENEFKISQKDKHSDKHGYIHAASELDQVIREMRISSRLSSCQDIQLERNDQIFGCYIDMAPSTFRRIMANLIKNSIEAINEKAKRVRNCDTGKVSVCLSIAKTDILVYIQDNGIGIPKLDLQKIGEKSFSTKHDGEGRGFMFSQRTIRELGGDITISSEENIGTTVCLKIPMAANSPWAASCLDLRGINEVGLLDDCLEDLRNVEATIKSKKPSIVIHSFQNSDLFMKWAALSNQRESKALLIDYDLGPDEKSGISLLSEIGSRSDRIYLVSNRYDDFHVQKQCEELQLKMIPKSLFSNAPIQV